MNTPNSSTNDKNLVQKAIVTPKTQGIFGRSNSPKEISSTNQNQNSTNQIQNTAALLSKLNLTGNAVKNNETFATKGSPKGATNMQTAKLQDQIRQLQQEQLNLQKKIPNIYQNVFTDAKNPSKPPNIGSKIIGNEAVNSVVNSKTNFGESSGSPKNQINPNVKQNLLAQNLKSNNTNQTGLNNDKMKGFEPTTQNQTNLFQSLLKKNNSISF